MSLCDAATGRVEWCGVQEQVAGGKFGGLVDLLEDTRSNLVDTEHHFFASCNGKGPCDGSGGWTRTYLRDEDIEEGNHLGTSQDVFDCLIPTM